MSVLVCGNSYEGAVGDHDQHLVRLPNRCRECKLKLNKTKLKFNQQSAKYNGHIFTIEGMLPEDDYGAASVAVLRPE